MSLVGAVLLSACFAFGAGPKKPVPLDQPLFVMTENRFAAGLGKDGAQFGDLLLFQILAGEKSARVGDEVPFYRGGAKIGTVTLKKLVPFECDSNAWRGKIEGKGFFPKATYAIASASKRIRSGDAADRTLTKDEQANLRQIGVSEFKKKSFDVKSGDVKLSTDTVMLAPERPSTPLWAGSLTVKRKADVLTLFMISEIQKGGTVGRADFYRSENMDDGKDARDEEYVDHYRLEGETEDRIITMVRGYEKTSFNVYKKTPHGWVLDFTGGESGC